MYLTNFILNAIYTWLITAASPLADTASEIMLFTNEPDVSDPTLAIADLTAPTFTGYADTAIAAWEVVSDANGRPYLTAPPVEYNPTNATDLPQAIRGAAIINGTDLLAVGYFPLAKVLSVADQMMHVTPRFQLDAEGNISFEADVV
jgi:hypothetical protein